MNDEQKKREIEGLVETASRGPLAHKQMEPIEYHTIAVRKGSVADRYLTKMREVHLLTYPEAIEQLIIEFDPDLDFLEFEGQKERTE